MTTKNKMMSPLLQTTTIIWIPFVVVVVVVVHVLVVFLLND
jgi:hypothetical protein